MQQSAVKVEVLEPVNAGNKARRIVIVGLAALLACGGATGWAIYSNGYESTDDAQVDGHLNIVSSRIGGTIRTVYVSDNQTVDAGQTLIEIDDSEQNFIKVVQRRPARIRLDAKQDGEDSLRPGMSVEANVWLR
jgi:multidrug resistance efflux pump